MAERKVESDITILTPKTIPAYAERTGESEEELLRKYHEANSQNKILYGFIHPGWGVINGRFVEVVDRKQP